LSELCGVDIDQDTTLDNRPMTDFPANPIEKPGYRLDWHDEFDGSTLDQAKWLPYHLPQWASRERSKARYLFGESSIVLQIPADAEPWSPEFDDEVKVSSLQTGVYSGEVGSNQGQLQFRRGLIVREAQNNERLYTPKYGYFECRAKACGVAGNHVSLWLIGYEEDPSESGEIAMFEVFGKFVGPEKSVVCYGVHPWGDKTLTDEFYCDSVKIDATEYHVYAFEWTPNHIDFYLDNSYRRRIEQSPSYPLQLMLSIFELPNVDPQGGYPKAFEVDYVRVYKPESGYS